MSSQGFAREPRCGASAALGDCGDDQECLPPRDLAVRCEVAEACGSLCCARDGSETLQTRRGRATEMVDLSGPCQDAS